MKQLDKLLLSVIIGFLFTIPAAVQAAPPRTSAYTKDMIRVRDEPKLTAHVIGTLEADVRVQVNSCAEGWCSVTTHGMTGYVLEQFLVRKTPWSPEKQRQGQR